MKTKLLLLAAFLISSLSIGQCDYTLELTDNFGNEWDSGANLTANTGVDVTVDGTTTTYLVMDPSTTANTPVVENYTITVNDGDAISIDYRATAFSGDGQFRLLDSEGIEVYASPLNQASMMDIFVGTATCPTCFAVTMLTTNAVTATSAEIGWTATGSETAWEVEFGPVGFTPGSGTTVNATANPWTIDGLMAETAYDVYVRADCGMGDISSNQGPISFTTTESCPAPGTFAPDTNTASTISFIWDANGNPSTNYEIEYGESPYAQGDGGTTLPGASAPFAIVTGLTSNTSYDFYVRIDCGNGDFSDWSGPYTASTLQSCPDISGITTANVLQTSVDLSWTAGGTETEWEIEYTEAPFTAGTETLVTTTSNPFTLTGLTSGTPYEICITAVCAPTDRSTPVCIQVTTECDSFSAPYTEDFEVGFTPTTSNFPGATEALDNEGCFTAVNSGYYWVVAPGTLTASGGTGPSPTVTTGNYLYAEGSGGATGDVADLLSPLFDTSGLTVPSLAFDYHMTGDDIGSLEVLVRAGGTDTSITTINGTQQLNDTDPFLDINIALNAFAGQTFQIVFRATRGGGFESDIAIDNIIVAEAPTCPRPLSFSFDGASNTTVDLSWIAGATETEWDIEYGAPGFTPGMGTVVTTTTNPFNLTGLTQNTTYDFYITAICGVGDESVQVGPVTGTTECDPFTAPYSEDFEAGFTPITTNFPSTAVSFDRENCYAASNSGYFWAVASGTFTGSANTGPDPSITTGNYFYAEGNGTVDEEADLFTPLFDSSSLTVPSVGFDYHMAGANIGSLDVIIRAGGVDTNVGTLTGAQQSDVTDPFRNLVIALPAYAGQTFQVIFKATRGNGTLSDIAIDNITIAEAPSCPISFGLQVDSSTESEATLSWTNGGTETAWEIEYVTPGAGQGSGTIVPASTNPFTVTGLSSNTPYEFYVRAICAVGDESLWFGPISGRTTCVSFTVPFTEGFNSTSTTQDCWTVIDANDDGDEWDLDATLNPSEGDQAAVINTDFNGGNDDDYLISPAITLTGVDRLRYDYRVQSAGEPNEMEVLISTTGSAPADFSTVLLPVATYSNTTYMEEVIDLTAYTGDVYVAWRIPPSSTDGWRMYIDNVRFEVIPSCDEPVMLTASGATTTSVDIAFTERGTATSWEIEYGAPGFVLGTGTTVNATSNPFTLTGLADSECFDYYVRSECAPGSFSPWSAVGSFCTLCTAFDVPFVEGFNSGSTTQQCWTVLDVNADGDTWNLDYTFNPFEGDQSANINTDFNGGVDDDYLISPPINLTAAGQRLKYNYRVQSANEPNNMEVLLSTTGVDPADFTNVLIPVTSYSNTTYVEEIIDLSSFTGPVYVAWRIPPSALDGWRVYIDNVIFEDIPSCPDPLMGVAGAIQANSAEIGWAAEPLATTVTIEYGPCGFVPGTSDPNAISVTATTNPFLISGLTAGTCYEAYVSFDCSGDASILSDVIIFDTQCDAIMTPYQEGFNSGSTTEDCWTVLDANGDGDTWDLDYATNPFEGDQSANINTDFNGGSDDDYLISPPITLTGNQQMRYQYRVQSAFEPNNMEILLSTTGVGAADFTVTLVPATLYSNTTYMEAIVDLSAYTGTVNVAFRIPPSTTDGWRMYIDDVNFEDRAACPAPDMLAVDMITSNGANFSWNETGSATVWQVEVQPTGTAQGTAGAIFENLTASNPQALSGLSAATTYDVFVRSDCGMGDFSDWVGPVTFTTLCDVITQYPYVTDFTTNVPNQCWDEAGSGEIADGPLTRGFSDWRESRAYENAAGTVVPSNAINLWQAVDREWLISESYDMTGTSNDVLTVEVAVTNYSFSGTTTTGDTMGSDDQVDLLITTDNGTTWTSLMAWNAANQPAVTGTSMMFDLSSYTGTVQFAFLASDGTVDDTEDYDFHVGVFTIDSTASNDAFAEAELVLYPNPVSTTLFVNADVSIDQLTIYNLMGQQVKQNVITDNAQVDVKDLPVGVYLIEIMSGSNKRTLRFIKE